MTVGGISTVRRCGKCGHAFTIDPAEARSAEAARRKLTCRNCTPPPPRDDGWRSMNDAELAAVDEWLDRHDPHRYVRDGRADPALSGDVPRSRCVGCGQMRPSADMHTVAGEYELCEPCWLSQPGRMPPPSGEAAVRYWHDDVPVYDLEPSGIPLEDRAYATRWWVHDDGGEYRDIIRTFVDWAAE